MAKFKWFGKSVSKNTRKKAIKANQRVGEALLTEANKTVPHDEGTLEQSGDVTTDEKSITTYISYDTPYAVKLHESPEYNFRGSGRGKWLEHTIKEMSDKIEKWTAKEMKKG